MLLGSSSSFDELSFAMASPGDGGGDSEPVACCPGTVKCVGLPVGNGRNCNKVLFSVASLMACSKESSVEVDGRLVEEFSVPQ